MQTNCAVCHEVHTVRTIPLVVNHIASYEVRSPEKCKNVTDAFIIEALEEGNMLLCFATDLCKQRFAQRGRQIAHNLRLFIQLA